MNFLKKALIYLGKWEISLLLLLSVVWVLDRPRLFIAFLGLPVVWLGSYLRTKRVFPVTPLDLPLLLFSILGLISLLITPDIQESSGKLLGVVLGISFYYGLVRLGENRSDIVRIGGIEFPLEFFLILMFIGSGVLVALLGLLGADWFAKYPLLSWIAKRLPGPLAGLTGGASGFQPNAISGTLTMFTPLSLYLGYLLFIRKDGGVQRLFAPLSPVQARIILAGALIIQGFWWLLAQTRGAWLGLIAGMIFLSVVEFLPKRKYLAWLLPLIPVIIVYLLWFGSLEGSGGDLTLLSGSQLTETLQFRLQVWDWAFRTLKVFPFTGVGFNIFRQLAPLIYFGSWLGDVAHAHNIWLDIGVTMGVGGIIIWISVWLLNLYSLWRESSSPAGTPARFISLGLLAGWYAYFVFGLADTIPLGSKLGLSIFFVLGLGQIYARMDLRKAGRGGSEDDV